MKKIIYVLALATLFIAGCSGASKKEEMEAQKEIITNDSIANEAEKNAADIQESMSEVDSLVNEL